MTTTKSITTSLSSALAPGFRFHPTDEELVRYYLTRKVAGMKISRIDAISEADIYKMEPWDLPGLSKMRSKDLEWYFYSALDKKYGNGARMNRATNKGYWKATGKDRNVNHDSRTIGMKKTLVFHQGRAPGGLRTNWVMHEYRLVDEELERLGGMKDGYVLCRVFEKSGLGPPNGDHYAPFDESEWGDHDHVTQFPKVENADEDLASDETRPLDGSSSEVNRPDEKKNQETQPKTEDTLKATSFLSSAPVCKNERIDTWSLPSIVRPKRPRFNDSDSSNALLSKCPSSLISDTSLSLESTSAKADAKENSQLTNWFNNNAFNMNVHPSYSDLINNLQNEIHSVSAERDNLRIEMMHAQTMLNVLQSRVNFLLQENEDLKRSRENM